MKDFFLLKVSIISCEKGANNEGDSHLICWDNICLPVNKGNPASIFWEKRKYNLLGKWKWCLFSIRVVLSCILIVSNTELNSELV